MGSARSRSRGTILLAGAAGIVAMALALLVLMTVPGGSLDDFVSRSSWGTVLALIAAVALCWTLAVARSLGGREVTTLEREHLLDEAVTLELAAVRAAEAPARLRSALTSIGSSPSGQSQEPIDGSVTDAAQGNPSLLTVDDWWAISQARSRATDANEQGLEQHLRAGLDSRFPMTAHPRFARLLFPRTDAAWTRAWSVLALGLLPIVVASLVVALLSTAGVSAGEAEVVGIVAAIVTALVLPAVFSVGLAARQDPANELRDAVHRAHATLQESCRRLARASRAATEHTVDPLSSGLIGCAEMLEAGIGAEEPRDVLSALQIWEKLLDSHVAAARRSTPGTICDEITRSCAPWSGLCQISTCFDSDLAGVRGPLAVAAGRIVEEAIGNACRHGHADEVCVTIAAGDDAGMTVCVDDNGSGPLDGAPGVGRTMFTEISRGQVSLTERADGGARLTVLLPWDFAGV